MGVDTSGGAPESRQQFLIEKGSILVSPHVEGMQKKSWGMDGRSKIWKIFKKQEVFSVDYVWVTVLFMHTFVS